MKVNLEHDFVRAVYRVWFYERGTNGTQILRIVGDNLWQREDVTEGSSVEPSFVLPDEAFEAFVREASTFLPPSAATDRHLSDAIGVRDRLLALVEKRK